MRDKRPVDELPIEELERILALRKREQRMARVQGYRESGRVVDVPSVDVKKPMLPPVTVTKPDTLLPVSHDAPQFDEGDFDEVRFVDESGGTVISPEDEAAEKRRRQRLSLMLLLVEMAAVVGLGVVFYLSYMYLQETRDNTDETQRELAAVRQQSRITPTPFPDLSPNNIIIPGGHTFGANGESSFNFIELERAYDHYDVPQNVRSALTQKFSTTLVQKLVNQAPTRSSDPAFLDIPKLSIRQQSIVSGADWETLREGVGWYLNGATLGTLSNVVLVGHNDVYGEIFRYLPDLAIGDEITVLTLNGQRYTYRVTETQIVEPTDVWVLAPDSGAHLTLITCYPYQIDTQRYIVFAELVS